jgi:hypothetical protein
VYRTKCSCINLDYFMHMHLIIPSPITNIPREGNSS